MVRTGQQFFQNIKVEHTMHNGVLLITINLEMNPQLIYFGWQNNIFIFSSLLISLNLYYFKMAGLAHGIHLIMKLLIILVVIKSIIIVIGRSQELNYLSKFTNITNIV